MKGNLESNLRCIMHGLAGRRWNIILQEIIDAQWSYKLDGFMLYSTCCKGEFGISRVFTTKRVVPLTSLTCLTHVIHPVSSRTNERE